MNQSVIILQSPGSGTETPPSVLELENNNLVTKLADLQQEKWMFEEKVRPIA